MRRLTIGSLFAGIGGFDLGFQRAGYEIKWQVEIDVFCRKVLAKHFPEAKRFEDVRTVGAADLAPVDVVCGGFPCQDISVAGKGAGITGSRSGLWSEMHRIVGELRPKYVVVENVRALLTRGISRVLGDLAEIGYDAEWRIVSACDSINTDHKRERIYILAYPNSWGLQKRIDVSCFSNQTNEGEQKRGESFRGTSARDVTDPPSGKLSLGRPVGRTRWVGEQIPWNRSWEITSQPVLDRTENGIPRRLDRLRSLGNAVVPQIPEWIANQILKYERSKESVV